MSNQARIQKAVYDVIDEVNKQLNRGVQLEKSPEAALYGKPSKLDSLDFVTFIMEVETEIQNEFGVELLLTDENLLSKEASPFRTVGTLVEHIDRQLKENGNEIKH